MIYILLSVRYSVTAFVATIGRRCEKLTIACTCRTQIFNVFYFRKRRKNKKNVKKR